MDIDLSKLLQSCKSHPSFNTIQVNKAWATSKFRISKSSQVLSRTTVMKKNSSEIKFPLSLQNKTFSPELGLMISSKKIVLRNKGNYKSSLVKQNNLIRVDKVYHTYAIPKKLRAVRYKGNLHLSNSEPCEVNSEVRTGAGNGRKRVNREIVLIKSCGSTGLLRKNEFYNEPYLRNLTEKFEE